MRSLRFGIWITTLSVLSVSIIGRPLPPEPHAFLSRHLGFSSAELATLDAGEILVNLPKTAETREVAAFAVARVDVPTDFFLEKFRDIENFKKTKNVLQIGKFGNPPRLSDLQGLIVDAADIEDLKRCKVKSCDFKMSAKFIERFRKEVDWTSASSRDRATQLVRQMLLEQLQDYLKAGNAALVQYDDKPSALALAGEMRSLLKPVPYMYGYTATFQKYLEEYPLTPTGDAGFEDFVYWSKEEFGMKPVISLTHVTIHRRRPGASDAIIASKGIYASHYFESSLGLTSLVGSGGPDTTRYLIYVNRSRTDALRGMLSGLKRSLIGGRLRDGVKKNIEMLKAKLEAQYTE
jgi:hypothetical protein